MAGANINRVILTGNLTRDVELRSLPSGSSVGKMRLAVNGRMKRNDEWIDVPNFFDITVWGAQAENCAKYLSKGSAVAIDGRLQWREWESDNGKRQAVDVVAESVQFLGNSKGGGSQQRSRSDIPVDDSDFLPAAVVRPQDDDIPF
jgi:single-strand DNA-binding protein